MKQRLLWRKWNRKLGDIMRLTTYCFVLCSAVFFTKLMTSRKRHRFQGKPLHFVYNLRAVHDKPVASTHRQFRDDYIRVTGNQLRTKSGFNRISSRAVEGNHSVRKQPGSEPRSICTAGENACGEGFVATPPNPDFIFHNKLPKSGSSTMNNIMKILRKKNNFNFMKVEPGEMTFYDRRPLVDFLRDKVHPPFVLLKHHYWINFTEYNMEQPTYINVIREPIEWFTSRYYFARYGWKRKPGCRIDNCGMTKQEFEMDIDECVATRHRSCTSPWMYLPFFCGATQDCVGITTEEDKKKALEIAKSRIAEEYYFVGILEEFEDTLKALELLLPRYFRGAISVWKGQFVQHIRDMTRTTFKKKMSSESEAFFRDGPLKYEVELYEFARILFRRRLVALNITESK